jgi:hypothetical protein
MADEIAVTPPNFADFKDSVIRTAVPVAVGYILTWAAENGVIVDELTVAGWVTYALSLGYYIVVRWIEQRFPQAGWLLGKAKAPVYVDAKQVEAAKNDPLNEG